MTDTEVASRVSRYASVAIVLHWTIAVLLVGLIAAGWWMTRGEGAGAAAPGTLRFAVFQLHKTFGILVLLLTLARIGWRLFNPPPPTHVIVLPWEKALSSAVYTAFYILMIALPLTGWALVSSSPTGFPTLLFGLVEWPHLPLPTSESVTGAFDLSHAVLAWTAASLVLLHIGGALKHQIIDRENILVRMAPGLFGRAEKPETAPRGIPVVFAAPVALAFVVFAAPIVADTATRPPVTDEAFAQGEPEPGGWAVDVSTSSISFAGSQYGSPFQGTFGNWTAQIVFDPADPGAARVVTTIDTTSIQSGDNYVNGSIASSSWLDSANHPQAVFEATGFSSTGPGAYTAEGTLTLKGVTRPVTLPFTLTLDGDTAHAEGTVVVNRRDFEIGVDTTDNNNAVTPEITVTVTVDASRAGAA